MQAQDIMTTSVITVEPSASVQEVARQLIENRVSAVPVVEKNGRIIGLVREGDLMRRAESGTERNPSWWLSWLAAPEETARSYVKTHGRHAADVMSHPVVSVTKETSIQEIAETLEEHRIKRVPVMSGDKLVGIVSRANLLRALAAQRPTPIASVDDRKVKTSVENAISEAGVRGAFLNVVVSSGVVNLWGMVETPEEKNAVRLAAETTPGFKEVRENIGVIPASVRAVIWAE